MKTTLLPCPFCGGKAVIQRKYIAFDILAPNVECGNKKCPVRPQTTACDVKGIIRDKISATAAWNRRA